MKDVECGEWNRGVRLLVPLTLGFDHRLINGADGARFLGYLRETLADPFVLALR